MKLINHYSNNYLTSYFDIKKTYELLAWKYYWLTLCYNVKSYIKGCNVCSTFKAVRHKSYGNFQFLPISTHWWKNLLMDFITGLPILIDWKRDSYNSIFVIIDRLTMMVHYKRVKITINVLRLRKVIINVIIYYHGLPDSIITNRGLFFILKFWLLLC